MNLTELLAAVKLKAEAHTYIVSFEHGYIVSMNDGHKNYPLMLMTPPQSQWHKLTQKKDKIYNMEFYLFALSDGMTKTQRDSAWDSQEQAIDKVITDLLSYSNELVLASAPTYQRFEDENQALFNQKTVWTECRFQFKITEC